MGKEENQYQLMGKNEYRVKKIMEKKESEYY